MNEENKKQIYNEASIMKKLFHPNVISFKEVFRDTKLDYFYIVMEYADDGDLNKKIKQHQNKKSGEKYFSEDTIIKYFYQICKGINYIHSKNIIHRDIKSQNIFLMKNGAIKIGDFGIAKALSKTNSNAMTVIGTPYYFSPEIINGEPYNYKTDIWSLGVVLYELCTLKLPFDSNNIAQLSIKILRGNYDPVPFRYSKDMHSIIKRMLNVDQNKRPDIREVMQSPLLQNINLNINTNNNNYFNKKKKNPNNNNQKTAFINSTASNLNVKINEPFLDQKKKERKSFINKKENKDKSCSPIKFKNRSFIGKSGFTKKNNENCETSIELPKKSEKIQSKKSGIFKRNISQKIITYKSQINEEKEDNLIINKDYSNNFNKIINKNINKSNKEFNNINNIFNNNINKNNNLININKNIKNNNNINNNFNNNINNINNISNNNNNSKENIKNIYNINNNINNNFNNINNNINSNINNNINNIKSNNNINNNLFYNGNFINKDEIINRSNAFDVNFSGKSILFDKEKTINLLNEDVYNKNPNNNFNLNKNNNFNNNYNFNEDSNKMFTLKEEDEDSRRPNSNLYNGDIDNLNFLIENNNNKSKEVQIQNNYVNNSSKKDNDDNVVKIDLDFVIINNSMNNEIEEKNKKEKNLGKNKDINEKFELDEYIKKQIGEKMYLIIEEYLKDMNIEQIVNYSFDKFINKLRDILKNKKFKEREIKNAEMYLFDVFFNIINKKNRFN